MLELCNTNMKNYFCSIDNASHNSIVKDKGIKNIETKEQILHFFNTLILKSMSINTLKDINTFLRISANSCTKSCIYVKWYLDKNQLFAIKNK